MLAAHDLPWQELHGDLRAFVARRVRNEADVDDLVQRVLLQIVKGLDSLRDTGRLHAWVYRTARNVIIDHYRATGSRREQAAGDAVDLDRVEEPPPSIAPRPRTVTFGPSVRFVVPPTPSSIWFFGSVPAKTI